MDTDDQELAPEIQLPSMPFYSVEYPGYVTPESIPLAIQHLGGQSSLDNAFKRTATKKESLLELNFRLGNPFSHPVPGDVIPTSNILLKVVKKRRKRKEGEPYDPEHVGDYTIEAMGPIPKTARFRSKRLWSQLHLHVRTHVDRHGRLSVPT